MQYIIMFIIVMGASISDIVTGILKAHIVEGYKSTIMKKGLYSKVLNWVIMLTAIGFEIGMQFLGRYYQCEELASVAGAIPAIVVFLILVLMELISIAENFVIANPDSPLAKVLLKRLQGISKKIESEVGEDDENSG